MGFPNLLSGIVDNNGNNKILPNKGDELNIRRANNDALVMKYRSGDKKIKASKTEYPNGTVCETRSYKK